MPIFVGDNMRYAKAFFLTKINKTMTVTEKADQFIRENGGNERDALIVALVRLQTETMHVKIKQDEIDDLREQIADLQFGE